MKKIMFLFAAVLVLAATGCSKEEAATNDVQYVSELKIYFAGDTKVSATSNTSGLKFAWENGDKIRVRQVSNVNVVRNFIYNSSTESFMATNSNDRLEVGTEYIAEYGETDNGAGNLAVLSGVQKAKGTLVANATKEFGNALPMVTNKFTASADNTIATMHHIVGLVEIPVKAENETLALESIQLSNPYGYSYSGWAGTYEVDLSTYEISVLDSQGEKYKKLTFSGGKSISTTKTSIFIPVLPMENINVLLQYKLVGKESSKNVNFNDNRTLTVKRGEITKISEVTLTNY